MAARVKSTVVLAPGQEASVSCRLTSVPEGVAAAQLFLAKQLLTGFAWRPQHLRKKRRLKQSELEDSLTRVEWSAAAMVLSW